MRIKFYQIALLFLVATIIIWQRKGIKNESRELDNTEYHAFQQELIKSTLRNATAQSFPAEAGVIPEHSKFSLFLIDGGISTEAKVRMIKMQSDKSISIQDQVDVFNFLSGINLPSNMDKKSIYWISDELLTLLRNQESLPIDLCNSLATIASRSNTDPIIRDYILQHLGHLWQDRGYSSIIELSLWKGTEKLDDPTTAGTALIALDSGYKRDHRLNDLRLVREKALQLIKMNETSIAIKITALSIAGEMENNEILDISKNIIKNNSSNPALKIAAHRILK